MQDFIRGRFAIIVSIAAFFWTVVLSPSLAYSQTTVEIPGGTRVLCTFPNAISPLTKYVGQRLTLRVSHAIVIDKVTVIEAGAAVTAEVTHSQKRGNVGKPAIIGITLYNVKAVDGSSVALSGQYLIEGENKQTSALVITILCCVLGLLQKGGKASIPEGAQVEGMIVATTKITIK